MPSSGVLSRGFQQAGLLPRNSLFRSKTAQAGLVNTFLGRVITVAAGLICPLMHTFGFSGNLAPHSGESPRRCLIREGPRRSRTCSAVWREARHLSPAPRYVPPIRHPDSAKPRRLGAAGKSNGGRRRGTIASVKEEEVVRQPLARNRRRGSRARLHRPAVAAHYLALSPF
jgi:hypothetical protein